MIQKASKTSIGNREELEQNVRKTREEYGVQKIIQEDQWETGEEKD